MQFAPRLPGPRRRAGAFPAAFGQALRPRLTSPVFAPQVSLLRKMDARDPIRVKLTEQLLEKLYNMGVIPGKTSMTLCDKLSTSSFCRCDGQYPRRHSMRDSAACLRTLF